MRVLVLLVSVFVFAGPVWGQPHEVGFLRYAFGELLLDGESLTALAVGSKTLKPEQKFETGNGFAEISLGADNYVRLDRQSGFQIASADRSDLQLRLLSGTLEVDFIDKNANDEISVLVGEAIIGLIKKGQYRLDMSVDGDTCLKVLRGQAKVVVNGSQQKVKSKQLIHLSGSSAPEKFKPAEVEDDFARLCQERAMEVKMERSHRARNSGDLLRDIPMRTW